jgi:uncharacterized membrane protein YphA (DoxX/SURF4 family)
MIKSAAATWLLRFTVAAVWLYHGLWNKLLSPAGRHAEIVQSAQVLAGIPQATMLIIIGVVEVTVAVWVLSGAAPRVAATVQTVLLILMNVGGLMWARESIQDPGAMIVQNIAFLALVWIVANREASRRERT